MPEIPDSLDDAPPVFELNGAIGRRASPACRQGQHDLCAEGWCECRHHGLTPIEQALRDRMFPDA